MQSKLRFYGTSSAAPSLKRGFACIGLVEMEGKEQVTLFDCGDGSISRILSLGTDVLSIPRIFITHYHSDHLSGIVQIIETMGIRKRKEDLEVFGPSGLVDYFSTIERITRVATNREFQIKLHELKPRSKEDFDHFSISCFEMQHTIPCIGYRVKGEDYLFGYSGDTEPCEEELKLGEECEFFVHEATYLEKDRDKARRTKHSTAREAGKAAKDANAKNLILTHVYDEFESDDEMLSEAQGFHGAVSVARDGLEVTLNL